MYAFCPLATPAKAQQIPAPVLRGLDAEIENFAPVAPVGSADFFASGQPTAVADNVAPIMGEFPNSPTLISGTTAYVNPRIPKPYVAPPPPPPPAAIRDLGPGRYMILPAESPLLTAPLATLNPASILQETETALPEVNIPATNLAPAPLQPAPEAAENITQTDIANRLSAMADRLADLSEKTAEMEQRATEIEQKEAAKPAPAPKPQPITATLPYVNDAIQPGPKAKAALQKMAEQLKAALPASNEGVWSVTALVQAPPISEPASAIAEARLQAVWSELRTQGLSLPKTPPAVVVVRAHGPQYLKLTVRP